MYVHVQKHWSRRTKKKNIGVFCFVLLIIIIQSIDPVSHLISAYADERSLAPITCSFFGKKDGLVRTQQEKEKVGTGFSSIINLIV